MAFDKDLVRSMAEPIIMSLLSERDMYGYEIIRLVIDRTGGEFEWKEGTLYPCLHRLEGAQLIRSRWSTAESGRERKYYSLTRRGTALLHSRTQEWSAFSSAVNTLLQNQNVG